MASTKQRNLDDLFYDTLKDIYYAERKILKTLPKMSRAATDEKLKNAFEKHREQTEGHVERLQQCFEIPASVRKARPVMPLKVLSLKGRDHRRVFE